MSDPGLRQFTIAPDSSMEEAAQKIEDNDYGTLIVVEPGGNRVVGTLTDGDLRKAFLKHRLAITPIKELMNTHFISVQQEEIGRAKDLFKERFYLRLLPVVDKDGHLCGVLKRDQF